VGSRTLNRSNLGGRRECERRAASAASSARWRKRQKERGLFFFQRWLTREEIVRVSAELEKKLFGEGRKAPGR